MKQIVTCMVLIIVKEQAMTVVMQKNYGSE
jgi:hypothetical protein